MGLILKYQFTRDHITEGQIWRPPDPIILTDEAGLPISSTTMTEMLLTLYDLSSPGYAIVNDVERVDVRNARQCTISTTGVFILTLLPEDTIILDDHHRFEVRRALVEYAWASGQKHDALEVTVVIRNLIRRPFVPEAP